MLELMVPLVSAEGELIREAGLIRDEITRFSGNLHVKIGTMIETPRGALIAGRLAETADFFSFGTNDLTQMTYGFSRDDAEAKFLFTYVQEGILKEDPFATLDTEGVGRLITFALANGKETNPDLHVGICGEHGGDPKSIDFCHEAGLDYVSCSPHRIRIARLAAAHAAIGTVTSSTTA